MVKGQAGSRDSGALCDGASKPVVAQGDMIVLLITLHAVAIIG